MMEKEYNIKQELLKQMTTDSVPDNQKISQEIISKNTTRVKRLKWIVIVCWLMVIVCFTIGAVAELNLKGIESDTLYKGTLLTSISVIIFRALFLIAIVLSISLFIRSRTLTLQKIQTRLANIEEQLKKLSINS
jgi:hypothetical protein